MLIILIFGTVKILKLKRPAVIDISGSVVIVKQLSEYARVVSMYLLSFEFRDLYIKIFLLKKG